MTRRAARRTQFLIVLLTAAGVLHFARPQLFEPMVPKALPRRKDLVLVSGAGELIGAALMAAPKTRRAGGIFSALLFAGVFPANVSMAMHSGRRPLWYRITVWARLPLQIPLIIWAWRAGR